MKFDHIIMNPPYCRNLHLKILNETVVHSDDVVCIHPARWLEDALWKEKPSSDRNKFSHLVDHINSVILLNSKSFGDEVGLHGDVAIIKYARNTTNKVNKYSIKFTDFTQSIFLKIKNKCVYIKNNLDSTKPYKLNIPGVHGHIDCNDFYELTSKDYNTALNVKGGLHVVSFDSEIERKNFHSSTLLNLYKFWNEFTKIGVHPNLNAPWLGDYTHQWTDEDCCKLFNLDDEQMYFICNTLKMHSMKEFINYESYK